MRGKGYWSLDCGGGVKESVVYWRGNCVRGMNHGLDIAALSSGIRLRCEDCGLRSRLFSGICFGASFVVCPLSLSVVSTQSAVVLS